MSKKPKCIIVTGRGGSGKTTLSKKLGQLLWMPVISRDEIKEGYVNTIGLSHDELPDDTNKVVSTFFFEVVNQYLTNNVSVVIEAAFQHRIWEAHVPAIAEIGDVFIAVCSIDDEVAARRHLERGLEEPKREFYHGDRRVAVFREMGVMAAPETYEPPRLDLPMIQVSTEGEYSPGLEEVVRWVRAGGAGELEAPA